LTERRIKMKDLNKLAKGGYQVAFSKKSNYNKYRKLLAKHGYVGEYINSSGPTIEGKYKRNAIYVMPVKKKTLKRQLKRKPTRRTGGLIGNFNIKMPRIRL
jgi:hypothetical protein